MNNQLNPEREQQILEHEAKALDIVYAILAEDARRIQPKEAGEQ